MIVLIIYFTVATIIMIIGGCAERNLETSLTLFWPAWCWPFYLAVLILVSPILLGRLLVYLAGRKLLG
jgi:hypothetical protein